VPDKLWAPRDRKVAGRQHLRGAGPPACAPQSLVCQFEVSDGQCGTRCEIKSVRIASGARCVVTVMDAVRAVGSCDVI
jgi:hypothetical protein